MPSARELRRLADEAERDATRWEKNARAARAQAVELRRMADEAERSGMDTGSVLHTRKHSGTVDFEMTDKHRMAISRSAGTKDPFLKAIRGAGYTQNSLAAKCGTSSASITRYRKKGSKRKAPRELVDSIAVLTGFEATPSNWPNGIADN